MRSKKKKVVGFSLCMVMVIIINQATRKRLSCNVSDDSHLAQRQLTDKWMTPSVPEMGVMRHDLNFTKFPLRNTNIISGRLEKFVKFMQPLNDFLTQLQLELKESHKSEWDTTASKEEYDQNDQGYIAKASLPVPKLHFKMLTANFTQLQYILEDSYFNTTATDCAQFGYQGQKIPGCNNDPLKTLLPNPLSMGVLNEGAAFFSQRNPSSIPVTYVHVFQDAFVDGSTGDISTKNFDLIIQRCKTDNHRKPSSRQVRNSALYNEVFSIAEFWGEGYFHHNSEQLPRLVPFLPFLTKNAQVFVHVLSKEEAFVFDTLKLLGIKESRVISGDIRARVLYSSVGSRCGGIPLITGQMLSLKLRQQIQVPPERRSLILVRRSHKRYFLCHDAIKKMLQEEAAAYGLELEIYGDNPPPSLRETAEIFNRAVMVVAPHGAGLANMMYSEPGTIIIEGVCSDESHPKINHCFEHSAFVLGHRYAAIHYPNKSCHYFQAADVKPVVKSFLDSLLLTGKS